LSAGRILVIDDEPQIRRLMRTTLIDAGYEVEDARTGEEGLEKVGAYHPDLVLLDMNMPGLGGLLTCEALRADKDIAIIMLTVRDSEADKIAALDAGADDYVTKPFNTPELLARIRATLRRVPAIQANQEKIQIGRLAIDFVTRAVSKGGVPVHLTPKELDLLRYFILHSNCVISHRELLQAAATVAERRELASEQTAAAQVPCAAGSERMIRRP